MHKSLYTIGYGGWTTATRLEKLIAALQQSGVTTLVDIRHSPCSSGLPPKGSKNYWPKGWHLQPNGEGLAATLDSVGIGYRWLVELGNPQKRDVDMRIMREHIASKDLAWPLNRGLKLLKDLIQNDQEVVCLMCASGNHDSCHRKLVAEEALAQFGSTIPHIKDLSS